MKNKILILITFLMLTGCASTNLKGPSSSKTKITEMDHRHVIFLEGENEYKKRNYIKAVKLFKEAAEQGHFMAQNDLGTMYIEGIGIEKNLSKGIYWIEKSASRSYDPTALYNLAQAYRKGNGVKKDTEKALKYYKISAKQDYSSAQYNLGVFYENGHLNLAKDLISAKEYYLSAAKQGHSGAQNNLGAMFVNEGNLDKARHWYLKAVAQGNTMAISNFTNLKKGEKKQ